MSEKDLDLLAFAPHPDDVEICCGGTLAKCAAQGHRVGIVDMTRGELGTQGTVEIRAKEAEAANKALGISLRVNLGLPDGGINELSDQVHVVVQCLREHRPKIVFVPYWEDRHPDHGATSRLLERAIFLCGLRKFSPESGKSFTIPQVVYYQMRVAFKPSFVVDVTDSYEKKLKSIECHHSQVVRDLAALGLTPGQPGPLISSPRFYDGLDARSRYYGAMVGATHGEPFLVKNALLVEDPVAFLSHQYMTQVIVFPEIG